MSIIINVLLPGGSILVSDSRMSNTVNGKTTVLSENIQKIFRIKRHVAVGFTGSYQLAMVIKSVCEVGPIQKLKYADLIAASLRNWLPQNGNQQLGSIEIIVSGLCSNGMIESFTLDGKNDYELKRYSIDRDSPVCYTMLCDTPFNTIFEASLIEAIQRGAIKNNVERQILLCASNHIRYVASINPTVNDNIHALIVKP